MAVFRIAANLCVLFALAISVAPGSADDDPKPEPLTPTQFADRLTDVIRGVADHYYYEIDNGELLRWAIKGLYEHRAKTMPMQLSQRLDKAQRLEIKELRGLLLAVANDCGNDLRAAAEVAVARMSRRLDGRTRLFELPKDVDRGQPTPSNGIGVSLAVDPATGLIRVQHPFFRGPAYRAGVRSGDMIKEIVRPKFQEENAPPPGVEVISTKGLSVATALLELAGDPGRSLYLNVSRPGTDKPLHFTVLFAKNEPESIFGVRRVKHDCWDHWLDPHRKIAYLRLATFRDHTHKLLANELAALRMQGMKALILDLRGNPGGLVNVATPVAAMLVGDVPLYSVRYRNQEEEVFQAEPAKAFRDFPIVCLVNRDTARMAEVLAACLQDHQRAVIVGERTQGHASIEHYSAHGDTFLMAITARIFLRPSGKKLDRIHPPGQPSDEWGVTPDKGFELILSPKERDELRAHFERQVEIPPPGARKAVAAFKDRQLEMAVAQLTESSPKHAR